MIGKDLSVPSSVAPPVSRTSDGPARTAGHRGARSVAAALVALAFTGALGGCGDAEPEVRAETVLVDRFERPDGVVTDERAWREETGSGEPDDAIWAATSGVLQVSDGQAWSDSPVFRMITHRRDFGDVAVSFRLRVDEWASDVDHPEEAWDGVHLLLHYQDETELYAVSVARRDGEVAIKRKDPGGPSNGGTYATLEQGPGAVPAEQWTDVRVTVQRDEDGLDIAVELDGEKVLETRDTDAVGERASHPGRIGVRADNTTFHIDHFRVERLG